MESIVQHIAAGHIEEADAAIRAALMARAAQAVADLRTQIATTMLDPIETASE